MQYRFWMFVLGWGEIWICGFSVGWVLWVVALGGVFGFDFDFGCGVGLVLGWVWIGVLG